MMVVNYHFAFGAFIGNSVLLEIANFFNGRASATFVVLAGVGIILFSRKARITMEEPNIISETRRTLIRRSLLLFLIGTLDSILWPADILRSYGVFFLLASFILTKRKEFYLYTSLSMILVFLILYQCFDFKSDWNLVRYQYVDFWTPKGFLKSLFFNGWNPIFPWFGLFSYGMFLGVYVFEEGKQLGNILKYMMVPFLILFLISLNFDISSRLHPNFMQHKLGNDSIFTVNQLPPLPLYYFLSIGFATLILFLFLKIGESFQANKIVQVMAEVGRYSHTIYLTHIYLGIIMYLWIRKLYTEDEFYAAYGTESIEFMWRFLILSLLAHIGSVIIWSKFFLVGPMELLVQKLSK